MNKFISIMEKVGHDIKVVFGDVVKYLPSVAALAATIFPKEKAAATGVVTAVNLIQQAVVTVEQKFAAAGISTGTGAQKLSQVLSIVTPSVTQLLTSEGITADASYVTRIVNAIVAVLNAQQAPAAA